MKKRQLSLAFIAFFGLTALAQTPKSTVSKDFSVSTGESVGDLKITVVSVGRELNKREKAAVEVFALILAESGEYGSLINEILVKNLLYGLAEIAKNSSGIVRGLNGLSDKQRQKPKLQFLTPDSKTAKRI